MLTIDGSQGEGGGQVLRTSLSLAMITGTPFRIENIRAKRSRPGLLRQHLTCVNAATQISGAKVTGAEIGSTTVTFEPGAIRAGDYTFAIGTAGATTLVFQTVWPALLAADGPSRVKLSGGTHNPFAPAFDYLDRVVCPLLAEMGARVTLRLDSHGFYPAGGGSFEATIQPATLTPLVLEDAGARLSTRIRADVANLPYSIAERELAMAATLLGWPPESGQARTVKADGPGNVVTVEIAHANVTEMFTSFGEQGRTAEAVAAAAVEAAQDYLSAQAPVGPHLADQLLLPMALAGGGSFITSRPTQHTRTNIAVIETFLPVEITITDLDAKRCRVVVTK